VDKVGGPPFVRTCRVRIDEVIPSQDHCFARWGFTRRRFRFDSGSGLRM
jgi:hypothetical protein